MKFSVLLSTYYKENPEYLKATFESLNNQTVKPNEIVLVEDGPLNDALYKAIDKLQHDFPQMQVVALKQNVGLGQALNEGLKYCSYDIVARMDTDDIAKPMRFEKQLDVFIKHPEFDVVGSWVDEFIDSTENVVSVRKLPETSEELYSFAKYRNPLNHPTVMFRKQAVMNVGGYKHFFLFEDYYLWVRMLMNDSKFYNVQQSLLWFRSSSDLYGRRGGWKYAMSEMKLQRYMYKCGFIGLTRMSFNLLIRFCCRLIPNGLRAYIYKKALRNSV